ncbi:MAG TPA: hypothetical protein VEL28_00020 [Candidatus Binatia bacterium]|nr:hypothetical protein [Candidatus Binatia bacterium]
MISAILTVLLCLLAGSASADIVADHADDVCPPGDTPCVINQRVEVAGDSLLDFGTRALIVGAGGLLDFGSGSATVLAGPITIGGDGVSVKGVDSGGLVTISAEGNLIIQSIVNGRTVKPGTLFLEATGNVVLASTIDMRGSTLDADGGSVCAESFEGSVSVQGLIKTDSGRFGLGGDIDLTAEVDVAVQAAITAIGGDTDGGDITIYAARDVLISGDVSASADGGAGYGGDIDIEADRNVILSGGTDADRTLVESRGHEDEDSFSGDGGDIDLVAGGNVDVGQFAVVVSEGSAPDGFSGYIALEADDAAVVEGRLEAVADGGDGEGGDIDITAPTSIDIASTGLLVVDAASPGAITLDSDGPITLDGSFSLIGKPGGTGGVFEVDSLADISVAGVLAANRPQTEIEWTACRITLKPTAYIDNNSMEGSNVLTVGESLRLETGSSLLTRPNGLNKLVYRAPSKPPVILGTVTPQPVLVVDETLAGCPVCLNGEVDEGELCDDGNTIETDACLSSCVPASCGDGIVQEGVEECDDQDVDETDGCSLSCDTLECADANGDGLVRAVDALRILQSAVGQSVACHPWVCDVNGDEKVLAGDALIALRAAVGLPVALSCIVTPTTTLPTTTTTTMPATTTTVAETTTTLPQTTTTVIEPTTTTVENVTTTTIEEPTTTTVVEPTTTLPEATTLPAPTTTAEPTTAPTSPAL